MSVHVRPTRADALERVDGWMTGLRSYVGPLPSDDPLVRHGGSGWLIATLGRELALVVDPGFPFTRPKVYVRGEREAMPHVERDGRLCLRNPEVPSDPVNAVVTAIRQARDLLKAVEAGSEERDFQEDFGLYWLQQASSVRPARLLLPALGDTGLIAWTGTAKASYGFASAQDMGRWWRHRFGSDPLKVREGAVVALDALPNPDDYPKSGSELWDLVEARSQDGAILLGRLLRQAPKSLLVVLTGSAPSGRRHSAGVMMARHTDARGKPSKRREVERDFGRGKAPPNVLCRHFEIVRLVTESLDAASSRLPYREREDLAAARVAVIGCGALGSGVARLLAKSGVGHLTLVDHEKLGWENIRRHQLGADAVGFQKASVMATAIARENPDVGSTKAYDQSVEVLIATEPTTLASVDLVIACTAAWSANSMLDETTSRGPPVLYGWMEGHALAAHAALIMPGDSYAAGYDPAGNARMTASTSAKPMPPECGALTSPFGAVELANAETLVGRLALDFLRGKVGSTTWRTWLADAEALAEAEGRWTPEWIAARGPPGPWGGVSVGPWWTA